MKRRLAMLLAATTVATIGMFAPSSPASAHDDVCAGQGTATLSTGFGLPGTVNTANFTFGFSVGACAVKTSLSATGTVTGACGMSSGKGVTNNGHTFKFTSTGTALVLTGEVTGTVSALEDPNDAGSCTNKTAVNFLITGEATLTHVATTTVAPCKEKPVPEKDVC